MDATAVITVSSTIVMLLQVLKAAGLEGRFALLTAAAMSVMGVTIWTYSEGNYGPQQAWPLFAGWVAVFTSAAGVFGIVNSGANAVATVKGAPKALLDSLTGKNEKIDGACATLSRDAMSAGGSAQNRTLTDADSAPPRPPDR